MHAWFSFGPSTHIITWDKHVCLLCLNASYATEYMQLVSADSPTNWSSGRETCSRSLKPCTSYTWLLYGCLNKCWVVGRGEEGDCEQWEIVGLEMKHSYYICFANCLNRFLVTSHMRRVFWGKWWVSVWTHFFTQKIVYLLCIALKYDVFPPQTRHTSVGW